MESIRVLNRPALVESSVELDAEFRSARWVRHRLIDFEREHEDVINSARYEIAPELRKLERIAGVLGKRAKRAKHDTQPVNGLHPKWLDSVVARIKDTRKKVKSDPRYKTALKWRDEEVGQVKKIRRTVHDTDESMAAKAGRRKTRYDEHRDAVYADRRCFHGTFMAQVRAVQSSRRSVLKARVSGKPARISRRIESEQLSSQSCKADALVADGFRVVERAPLWWTMKLRVGREQNWVTFRAKCGNWHTIPDGARIVGATLNRKRDGMRYRYSVSLTIRAEWPERNIGQGVVALDWGCRERHDGGILAFTWNDGNRSGRVFLPPEIRGLVDRKNEILSRLDSAFNARSTGRRNRHSYRKELLRLGVMSNEQREWLDYETRKNRQVASINRRIDNLRKETYTREIQELAKSNHTFVFEKLSNMRALDKEGESARRKRQNRELTSKYMFEQLCERFGGAVEHVSARNSSRECPKCGKIGKKSSDVMLACESCGHVRDRDEGAAEVLRNRALANLLATTTAA